MKIAFTSCMDATRVPHQPVWDEIARRAPDHLLLLGDHIYMDWMDLGASQLRRHIVDQPDEGLAAFEADMHQRYRTQAAVPEFAALLQQMGPRIHLAWDDHDFAWNNALGGGPAAHERSVPETVKRISRRLFEQFRRHVHAGGGAYPAADAAPDVQGGIQDFTALQAGNLRVPLAMLDTRWWRNAREAADASLLGPEQQAELLRWLADGAGLAIVTGGSALKHNHLSSEQDWHGDGPDAYPEFHLLLQRARRPVLYLSGDVHRNAWGGRIRAAAGRPSEVLQLLASPAAIPALWAKRFSPSFGWLEVEGDPAGIGQVVASLQALQPDGVWCEQPLLRTPLAFSAEGWTGGALGGEAAAQESLLQGGAGAEVHALVCCERRRDAARGDLSAPLSALDSLDGAYLERVGGLPDEEPKLPVPEAIRARLADAESEEPTLTLKREPGGVAAIVAEAFAVAGPERAVVLFIHGLGKSPVQAIDQAFMLRHLHGGACVPLVFCWPAGRGNGILGGLLDFGNAQRAATSAAPHLRAVLQIFAQHARRREVAACVVLARSAGAGLLMEVLADGAGNDQLSGIDRIVLSSPAMERSTFRNLNAYAVDPAPPPTFVMVNQTDRSLRLARWVTQIGPALGAALPRPKDRRPGVAFVDYTGTERIAGMHDYLLVDLNPVQHAVNRALLTQRDVDLGRIDGVEQVEPGLFRLTR